MANNDKNLIKADKGVMDLISLGNHSRFLSNKKEAVLSSIDMKANTAKMKQAGNSGRHTPTSTLASNNFSSIIGKASRLMEGYLWRQAGVLLWMPKR